MDLRSTCLLSGPRLKSSPYLAHSILKAKGKDRVVADTGIQSFFWDMIYFVSTHMQWANAIHT